MTDKSKKNEKASDEALEEEKKDENLEENDTEGTEETEESETSENTEDEIADEDTDEEEDNVDEETTEESDEELKTEISDEKKPIEEKTKKEEKKEPGKKKDTKDDDFRYIVRISNTDIDGNKKLIRGLTSIKGVGMHISALVADRAGIDRQMKMGDLSESQIEKLQKTIDDITNFAPGWMLNHRKQYETGEDMHLVGSDIDMRLRDEINIMKKIRSYRGIRHERGLPVRGQRTRANNRKGLALGVSKRREQPAAVQTNKE